jgi:hypothetical protein
MSSHDWTQALSIMSRKIGCHSLNVGYHTVYTESSDSISNDLQKMGMVFVNYSEEDVIYPLNVKEIAPDQSEDVTLKKRTMQDKYSILVLEDTQLLFKDCKMVTPKVLPNQIVSWYHHYLQHPGHTHLEERLCTAMYWKSMRHTI